MRIVLLCLVVLASVGSVAFGGDDDGGDQAMGRNPAGADTFQGESQNTDQQQSVDQQQTQAPSDNN